MKAFLMSITNLISRILLEVAKSKRVSSIARWHRRILG